MKMELIPRFYPAVLTQCPGNFCTLQVANLRRQLRFVDRFRDRGLSASDCR